MRTRWTPGMKFWHRAHKRVNRLAWRFQPPDKPLPATPGEYPGWLWRVNDWLAARWVPRWIDR